MDALHDFFAGNENARPQARQFIHALSSIAAEIDGAVLLTAHPSLSGLGTGSGMSGSTAWSNSVRSRLYLTRPKDDDTEDNERVLRRMKANYAGIGDEIYLTWAHGVFTHQPQKTGIDAAARRAKAKRVFPALLATLIKEGINVSPSPKAAATYAPTLFSKRPKDEREELLRDDFQTAMRALLADGVIEVEEHGPATRGWKRLRVVKAVDE